MERALHSRCQAIHCLIREGACEDTLRRLEIVLESSLRSGIRENEPSVKHPLGPGHVFKILENVFCTFHSGGGSEYQLVSSEFRARVLWGREEVLAAGSSLAHRCKIRAIIIHADQSPCAMTLMLEKEAESSIQCPERWWSKNNVGYGLTKLRTLLLSGAKPLEYAPGTCTTYNFPSPT